MPAGQPKGHPTVPSHAPPAQVPAAADLYAARVTYRRKVQVIESDGRYPLEAFEFLQDGLEHAVRRVHGAAALDGTVRAPVPGPQGRPQDDPRHVGGSELCLGLRELALDRWGKLGRTVLQSWGIFSTRDFGEMVFVLVDHGFLQKSDRDRIADFDDIFPLTDLEQDFQIDVRPLDVGGGAA